MRPQMAANYGPPRGPGIPGMAQAMGMGRYRDQNAGEMRRPGAEMARMAVGSAPSDQTAAAFLRALGGTPVGGGGSMPGLSGGYQDELKRLAFALQNHGRGGDTILAHINPREAQQLHQTTDGGSINPQTGLLEFTDSGQGDGPSGDGPSGGGSDTGGSSDFGGPGGSGPGPDIGGWGGPDTVGQNANSSLGGLSSGPGGTETYGPPEAYGPPEGPQGRAVTGSLIDAGKDVAKGQFGPNTAMNMGLGTIGLMAGPVGLAMGLTQAARAAGLQTGPEKGGGPDSPPESGPGGGPEGGGTGSPFIKPTQVADRFARPAAMDAPSFLDFESDDPLQRRSKIATFATQGTGGKWATDEAFDYWKNLTQRGLVSDAGQMPDFANLLGTELGYLGSRGIAAPNQTRALLEAILSA